LPPSLACSRAATGRDDVEESEEVDGTEDDDEEQDDLIAEMEATDFTAMLEEMLEANPLMKDFREIALDAVEVSLKHSFMLSIFSNSPSTSEWRCRRHLRNVMLQLRLNLRHTASSIAWTLGP
jgi:hypothetical protein